MVHHPTIIAAHCEGRSWQFAGDAEVRSKFWGRYIELTPVGLIRLKFSDGDEYHWSKVGCPGLNSISPNQAAGSVGLSKAILHSRSGCRVSPGSLPSLHVVLLMSQPL